MNRADIRRRLLAWYARARRDLPWRRTRDPYRIWVSEAMLQQTRVDTALPYYERFLDRFPTLEDLASARDDEILKAWEGLGYYSRARNLARAARACLERHAGCVPDDPAAFGALPGVGPYTVAAVQSIAYGAPLAAVDGNVARVLARVAGVEEDVRGSSPGRRRVERIAADLVPARAAADWNQALMELGALVCTPRSPRCELCPIAAHCAARLAGLEDRIPPRPQRKFTPLVHVAAALLARADGAILVSRRPPRGLLAGLYELPAAEKLEGRRGIVNSVRAALARSLSESLKATVRLGRQVARREHAFTHRRWDVRVFEARVEGDAAPAGGGLRFASPADLRALPFAGVYAKVLADLGLRPA